MNSAVTDLELAEPYLLEVLAGAGLDVEYVRAEGTTLYRLGPDGTEIPVLDLAGGFGSLILGHNNPEIVACAHGLLDAQVPVHAQFSRHSYANRLAAGLSAIVQRELAEPTPYRSVFASTGAEAIEVAVKHAEFVRRGRVDALAGQLDAATGSVRAAVLAGTAAVTDASVAAVRSHGVEVDLPGGDDQPARFERLAAAVVARNAERLARPPLFLALEGGFHGKLVASVQLTHNAAYRTPFSALAAQARFVPAHGRPGAILDAVAAERVAVLQLVVTGAGVDVEEHDLPVFCAFFVEPIQGEAGINVIDPGVAAEIEEACRRVACPLVVDEIQSGMGRTGSFLASSRTGPRGDYFLLAKSLGGGLAKSSAVLIRQDCYAQDFELVHSSTFAKDALSCFLGVKVLELLEADGGRAYQVAEQLGNALTAMLEDLRGDFPDVVAEVRGLGLMVGIEFRDQSEAASEPIREAARSGYFGFVMAGYLLRAHAIRIFPTVSAVNTLRFEPALQLTDADIAALDHALRALCALLRDQDGAALTAALGAP